MGPLHITSHKMKKSRTCDKYDLVLVLGKWEGEREGGGGWNLAWKILDRPKLFINQDVLLNLDHFSFPFENYFCSSNLGRCNLFA